ncbi:unnamed protein product [Macrosiphum euphorbiae]|nr:unnamed protein product [Macrosiphum euphorbiae]
MQTISGNGQTRANGKTGKRDKRTRRSRRTIRARCKKTMTGAVKKLLKTYNDCLLLLDQSGLHERAGGSMANDIRQRTNTCERQNGKARQTYSP